MSQVPDPRDVVLHVRLCDSPFHYYKYYDVHTYFGPILARLRPEKGGRLRLVTTCDPKKVGVAADLVRDYGAIIAHPVLEGDDHGLS